MARVNDGLKTTRMTPIDHGKVHGGVKPPGMTPTPTQTTPTPPPTPPHPDARSSCSSSKAASGIGLNPSGPVFESGEIT